MRELVALLTLAASLVGCAASGEEAGSQNLPPLPSEADMANGSSTIRDHMQMLSGMSPDPTVLQTYQDSIARCMQAEGFEYVAWNPPSSSNTRTFDGTGYGVYIDPPVPDDPAAATDPNVAIVQGMSEQAQVEYGIALFGDDSSRVQILAEDGSELSTVPGAGCVNSAHVEAYGRTIEELAQEASSTLIEWNEAMSAADSDPRAADAWGVWSACMQDAGFEFASRDEIQDHLVNQGLPADEGRTIERAVLEADLACDRQTGLTAMLERIARAWENRFVEQHPDLLGATP